MTKTLLRASCSICCTFCPCSCVSKIETGSEQIPLSHDRCPIVFLVKMPSTVFMADFLTMANVSAIWFWILWDALSVEYCVEPLCHLASRQQSCNSSSAPTREASFWLLSEKTALHLYHWIFDEMGPAMVNDHVAKKKLTQDQQLIAGTHWRSLKAMWWVMLHFATSNKIWWRLIVLFKISLKYSLQHKKQWVVMAQFR